MHMAKKKKKIDFFVAGKLAFLTSDLKSREFTLIIHHEWYGSCVTGMPCFTKLYLFVMGASDSPAFLYLSRLLVTFMV